MSRVHRFQIFLSVFFGMLAILILATEVFAFQKISDSASHLAEVQLRSNKISEKEASLSSLKKRYADTEEDIPKINTALPDQKEVSRLLSDLDTLATDSGLKLTLLQSDTYGKKQTATQDPTNLQTVKGKNSLELPLDIKIEGGFSGLTVFIKKIENYQRLINISSIEITKPTNVQDQTDKIEAKLKITAFLKK